jgi:multiple sugar transport system ATP-binding protein
MATIKLENLKKQYPNGFVAVHDINLEINDQEFLVLVGPSGCAKSTTLKMVAGLEDISSGSIYIDDKKVNDLSPKDRDIAMVFQSYALYPHMTVRENISFGLKMRKHKPEEIVKRVAAASDMLGINDLLDRFPKQLSGGQRQRVALGRAIVRKPKVFLFDEPLSNLDAKLRVQMRTEIKKLHERLQATIIYVTHDQIEAMTMGTRIVLMKAGHIMQVGPPMELYNSPVSRFVAGFIGSPAMNFIDCHVEDIDGILHVVTEDFKLALQTHQTQKLRNKTGTGEKFSLGIRPEDIRQKRKKKEAYTEGYITGNIEVVEPIGKEIGLEISTGNVSFSAIVGSNVEVKSHQSIALVLKMDKIHLFEKTEGELAVF